MKGLSVRPLWLLTGAVLLVATASPARSQAVLAFGLTNAPLGQARLELRGSSTIVVQSTNEPGQSLSGFSRLLPGHFGVSTYLGEADAGVWAYPFHDGEYAAGSFLVGHAFGEVDGTPNQPICAMRVRKTAEAFHEIETDFSMIGARMKTIEVYWDDTLVATSTSADAYVGIESYYQNSPRGNPFWRLRDGSIASVVELSETASIYLAGSDSTSAYGNRIVTRAVDPGSEVGFVSRVDFTGGGGISHFLMTQMRLGVFNHTHLALGHTILDARAGTLGVSNLSDDEDFGVSIELDRLNTFHARLAPVRLETNGAALVASAIGSVKDVAGEFLGFVGVGNSNDVWHAVANLPSGEPELEIAVYLEGGLVSAVLTPGSQVAVELPDKPGITGFGALAGGEQPGNGWTLHFEGPTSLVLPGGGSLRGDEVRFRTPQAVALERLTAFNIVGTHVPAFTIREETELETVNLADYLVDLKPQASIKHFMDAYGRPFLRSVALTNRGGEHLLRVTETYSNAVAGDFFSLRGGEWVYHGSVSPSGAASFSASGLRLLSGQIRLGESTGEEGSFEVWDPEHGTTVSQVTRLRVEVPSMEAVQVPAGTFQALLVRVTEKSIVTLPGGGNGGMTEERRVVREWWLAEGIGLVKSMVSDRFGVRMAELADYIVIASSPQAATVSTGGGVVFDAAVSTLRPAIYHWQHEHVPAFTTNIPMLFLSHVTAASAGSYSLAVSNALGVATMPVGSLRVLPFSEPGCFWAQRAGGTAAGLGQQTFGEALSVDGAGNVYVAGRFRGPAVFDSITLQSVGGFADLYVAKLSPTGQYRWAIRAGNDRPEILGGAAADAAGNVYIAGSFEGSMTLGATTLTSAGSRDVFVAKIDPNGNFLWAVRGGSADWDTATGVAVDSEGTVYVTGTFSSGGNSGQFGPFVLNGSGLYGYNLFVCRLSSSGSFVWATGVGAAQPSGFSLQRGGDLYLAGSVYGPVTFGDTLLDAASHETRGFLARLGTNGVFVWVKELGMGDNAANVAAADDGNVLVTGRFQELINFGNITLGGAATAWHRQQFVAKVDSNGNVLWARMAPGESFYGTAIAADHFGHAYLVTRISPYQGPIQTSVGKLQSLDSSFLMSKLDGEGRTLWIKQFGGAELAGVRTDTAGNIYLAGTFGERARFGDFVLQSTPALYNNLFAVKMCVPALPVIITQPQPLSVQTGTNISLSVAATNVGPLNYQWRKDGVNIPGATNASYLISHVQPRDTGDYSVIVAGHGGSVASVLARLNVVGPPRGTIAFGSPTYLIDESAIAYIEVTRTGSLTGLVTVAFSSGHGTALADEDYVPVAGTLRFAEGESSKSFALVIVDDLFYEEDETVHLRLLHPGGGALLGSQTNATLLIANNDSPAPYIVVHPRNRSVGLGWRATFHVTVTGAGPLRFQWRRDGVNIPGANASSLTIAAAALDDAGAYSVYITSASGEAISSPAMLRVYPPPVIHEQPRSQNAARWTDVTFQVVASGFNTATQSITRTSSSALEDRFAIETASLAGRLTIDYEFFNVPDTLRVYHEGNSILDLGPTGGAGRAHVYYAPVYYSSGAVEVVVNEGSTNQVGNAWTYHLRVVPDVLYYQWHKDGEALYGANWPLLRLSAVTTEHAGQYSVTVWDQFGSVTSETVTLAVVSPPPPQIRITATSDGTVQVWWEQPTFYLEAARALDGPWQYIRTEGTFLPLQPNPSIRQHFFRLRENPPPADDDD